MIENIQKFTAEKGKGKKIGLKFIIMITFVLTSFGIFSDNLSKDKKELIQYKVNRKSIDTYLRGESMTERNWKSEELKKIYLEAIRLDKRNYMAWKALGDYYMMKNDFPDGAEAYENAIKANPKKQSLYLDLAFIYYEIYSDYSRSKDIYEKIVKLFPESPAGYSGLANVYSKMGKFEESIRNAEMSIEKYKKDKTAGTEKSEYYSYYDDYGVMELIEQNMWIYYKDLENNEKTVKYIIDNYSYIKKLNINGNPADDMKNSIITTVREANLKIKSSDEKLYEKNLKKFKELGI